MYILVYDIANANRLRNVAKIVEQYMNRVQKSVFEGDNSASEIQEIRIKLKEVINVDEDYKVVRFSFSHLNTLEEVDYVFKKLREIV